MAKEHENTLDCPMGGRSLHKDNLVGAKSVVEDNLYDMGGVRIVSNVRLECDFEHQFNEEGFTMDDLHKLVMVINTEFSLI